MNFVKLILSPYNSYSYQDSSNTSMCVLGIFLSSAIGYSPSESLFFKDWVLADKADSTNMFNYTVGTNATLLEEDNNGDIHIVDDTGSDPDDIHYIPAHITMTKEQFARLLEQWQEKVCKYKPKEVIITYDNDQFNIKINGSSI